MTIPVMSVFWCNWFYFFVFFRQTSSSTLFNLPKRYLAHGSIRLHFLFLFHRMNKSHMLKQDHAHTMTHTIRADNEKKYNKTPEKEKFRRTS